MITAAALIALDYFKVDYYTWLFVVTVMQDLAVFQLCVRGAK